MPFDVSKLLCKVGDMVFRDNGVYLGKIHEIRDDGNGVPVARVGDHRIECANLGKNGKNTWVDCS